MPATLVDIDAPRKFVSSGFPRDLKTSSLSFRQATVDDLCAVYRLRHDVYARELGQHVCNAAGELRDRLDEFNQYLVAMDGNVLAGFISITPPEGGVYSLDKYLPRDEWQVPVDDWLYEVRLLTVAPAYRATAVGPLLMYAALRWINGAGGRQVVAIGRREVLGMYLKVGLHRHGREFRSGAVHYELLSATVPELLERCEAFSKRLDRLQERVQWNLSVAPFRGVPCPPVEPVISEQACCHGGAFFEQIGEDFSSLERRENVINADVLDAWFPPAPQVLTALQEHLDWILRTSPPTQCAGLLSAISAARGVPADCIVPGAGSSDLIYRALTHWLTRRSRVLILDPTYGEYRHVLQHVIGCQVETIELTAQRGFRVDPDELRVRLQKGFDLVCLVNPNNPTGQHLRRVWLEETIETAPAETRFWIDEAYLDYVGENESLEQFAARKPNVVVCKTLSKVYALSGVRAGYLCAAPAVARELRNRTPPWVIGLPGQVAGVLALRNRDYYRKRYAETHVLRVRLQQSLESLGLEVFPGTANFLYCRCRGESPDIPRLLSDCRREGLFLRDTALMSRQPDGRSFRVAVKDAATSARMVEILERALCGPFDSGRSS